MGNLKPLAFDLRGLAVLLPISPHTSDLAPRKALPDSPQMRAPSRWGDPVSSPGPQAAERAAVSTASRVPQPAAGSALAIISRGCKAQNMAVLWLQCSKVSLQSGGRHSLRF